jgi:hypothetical protein
VAREPGRYPTLESTAIPGPVGAFCPRGGTGHIGFCVRDRRRNRSRPRPRRPQPHVRPTVRRSTGRSPAANGQPASSSPRISACNLSVVGTVRPASQSCTQRQLAPARAARSGWISPVRARCRRSRLRKHSGACDESHKNHRPQLPRSIGRVSLRNGSRLTLRRRRINAVYAVAMPLTGLLS